MYLANQVGWKADYIASVNASGDRMQLNGWVRTHQSQRHSFRMPACNWWPAPEPGARKCGGQNDAGTGLNGSRPGAGNAPGKLGDYHLYTLERPTTVLDNQTGRSPCSRPAKCRSAASTCCRTRTPIGGIRAHTPKSKRFEAQRLSAF